MTAAARLVDPLPQTREAFDMFEATARLTIREGELDAFKRQAAEIVGLARDAETKPLRYDWFISDDGTQCEVREAYVDADALVEHQRYIAEAKMKLFREFATDHAMEFYGELSPALVAVLEAMGTKYRQFTFFQGLETADTERLEEVHA